MGTRRHRNHLLCLQSYLITSSHSAKILERGIYSASTSDGSSTRRDFQALQRGGRRSGINSALRFGCGLAALCVGVFAPSAFIGFRRDKLR